MFLTFDSKHFKNNDKHFQNYMERYFLKQFFKNTHTHLSRRKIQHPLRKLKKINKRIKTHKWSLGHKHFSKLDLYFSKKYSSLTLTSFYTETELNTFNNHLPRGIEIYFKVAQFKKKTPKNCIFKNL